MQLAVANVERLVLDQQANDLAVGRVDHRLSRLRIAITRLGIRKRPRLVQTRQVCPQHTVRLALVEISPEPDVPIGQCEHRLGLGETRELERHLAHGPRLDRERSMLDHVRPGGIGGTERLSIGGHA
jgi:hypothetical protein